MGRTPAAIPDRLSMMTELPDLDDFHDDAIRLAVLLLWPTRRADGGGSPADRAGVAGPVAKGLGRARAVVSGIGAYEIEGTG